MSAGWSAEARVRGAEARACVRLPRVSPCPPPAQADGVIKALYQGKTKSFIRCKECGYEGGSEAVFLAINLLIKEFGQERCIECATPSQPPAASAPRRPALAPPASQRPGTLSVPAAPLYSRGQVAGGGSGQVLRE